MLSSEENACITHANILSSINTEIVTEQLGFVPMSFIDDVINSTNEYVFQGMASLEEFVTAWYAGSNDLEVEQVRIPSPEKGKLMVEKGIAQLETLLLNAVDKRFDEFELYCLQSVFSVPDDLEIRLPHQVDLDIDGDEGECDVELAQLRKRLASVRII
jgi:hypothetical protein